MTKPLVKIEYVQNCVPFPEHQEYVVIYNGTSDTSFNLKGWKLIYKDSATGTILHTHHFYKLAGTFAPGERLCVLSGHGNDRFVRRGGECHFPHPHWDLYINVDGLLMKADRLSALLFDQSDQLIDSASVVRSGGLAFHQCVIFIGHGNDGQWRELKDHLHEQHGYPVETFEILPRAGLSVKQVLEDMLHRAGFAFLVFTAEDLDAEGGLHARENVIHELGLFQGRLGFEKTIAVVEERVREFSNIHGLVQIRFRSGRIREIFGDAVAHIRRELVDHALNGTTSPDIARLRGIGHPSTGGKPARGR